MTKEQNLANYSLADLVLPLGIQDFFTLTKVEEIAADLKKEERDKLIITDYVLSDIDIHIHLEEKDNRTDEQKTQLSSNGYTEPTIVQDFPIRNRRVYLHIKRRRWLTKEGKNLIIQLDYPIVSKGIKLSPQFADFLKGTDGYYDSECAATWRLLQS